MISTEDSHSTQPTNREHSIRRFFIAPFEALWLISLLVTFLHVNYLQRDSWSNIWSFHAAEQPSNVAASCLPRPLGVHYFGDLVSVVCHSIESNPYAVADRANYLPFAYVLARPFGPLLELGIVPAITALLLVHALFSFCCVKVMKRSWGFDPPAVSIPLLLVFSAPAIGVIDRGNFQVFVYLALVLWLLDELKGNPRSGAVWLGLAAAIKGYPALLAVVYLARREFRQFGIFVSTAFLATFIPLLMYPGGMFTSAKLMTEEILKFRGAGDVYLRHNSSLLALLRSLGRVPIEAVEDLSGWFQPRMFAVGLAVITSFVLIAVVKKLGIFETSLMMCVASCLFIGYTGTYALGMLLVPVLAYGTVERETIWSRLTLGAIAVVLVPKGFTRTVPYIDGISMNSVLNPTFMILAVMTVMTHIRVDQRITRAARPI